MTRGARPSGRCVRSGRRGRAGRDARSCSRSAVRTPACAWARPLRRLAGLPRNAIIFRKARGKGAFSSLLKLTQAFGGGKALLPAPPRGQPVLGSWERLFGACAGAQPQVGFPEELAVVSALIRSPTGKCATQPSWGSGGDFFFSFFFHKYGTVL